MRPVELVGAKREHLEERERLGQLGPKWRGTPIVDDRLPELQRSLVDRRGAGAATRVVEQKVDPAVALHRRLEQGAHRVLVSDIRRHRLEHTCAGRCDLLERVGMPAGEVAVIDVAELNVKPVAAVAPKVTAVTPVKFVPVIVTDVPPTCGPAVGEIDVTVGAGIYVNWSAAVVPDVPPAVVTLMSTVPVPAGDVAVI